MLRRTLTRKVSALSTGAPSGSRLRGAGMGASMSLTSGSCGSLTSSSTLMPMSSRYLSRSSLGIITFRLQRLSSCPRLRLRGLGGRLVAAQEPVLEYLHQHRYHEV